MKKLIFLFSLLISSLSFAQWDGNFPGDGSWQGDSIIVIDGDTLVVTFPGDDNPWDNDDWGGEWPMDSMDCGFMPWWSINSPCDEDDWSGEYPWGNDWAFGDSIEVINDSTIVIAGDTIVVGNNDWEGNNPWDENDWDNENPWDNDWGFGDSIEVINDTTIVIAGDTIVFSENDWGGDFPNAGEMIEDCNGEEAPESWIADGYCDNGAWGVDFNCEAFDFDGGDCEGWDEENPWDNDDWDDEWDGEWPSDSMDCGDMPWWPEDFPCDENDWDWNEDSLDWDNDNWGESGMIEDCNGDEAPENWVGDGYCDNGAWGADFNCEAFDFDGGDCEGWDEENPWDNDDWDDEWDGEWPSDSIDCGDMPWWSEDFPCDEDDWDGDNPWDNDDWNGEWPWDNDDWDENDWDGENPWDNDDWDEDDWDEDDMFEDVDFDELYDIIGEMELTENELVLILEDTDIDLSIFDMDGFEFTPNEVDGYLVFGPFSFEDLYSIIIEGMEELDIDWGLFRPAAMQMMSEGTITSTSGTIGGIFEVASMLSIDEMDAELEVYSTQYFDLAGREVAEPNNGVFIEVKHTNKGMISEKVFIKR